VLCSAAQLGQVVQQSCFRGRQADWFAKHRQQRPAVAVLFLERCGASGPARVSVRIRCLHCTGGGVVCSVGVRAVWGLGGGGGGGGPPAETRAVRVES